MGPDDSYIQIAIHRITDITLRVFPWITTDREASAMLAGLLIGGLAGWFLRKLFHNSKIDQKEAEIKGLQGEIRVLEREKEELKRQKAALESTQFQSNEKKDSLPPGRLSLEFDPQRQRVPEGELIQCFVVVRNTGAAAVDKAAVTIEEIQSLSHPIEMERELTKYKGLPLMLKEDMYKQNDLPKKDFYIFGHSDVELIAMRAVIGSPSIILDHAEYRIGYALTSNGRKAREPAVPLQVPAGKYRLYLALRGSDGTFQRKTFLVSLDTERFYFAEDT